MKVSVVIPVHNAEAWLESTLQSVANQTYSRSDMEVIVVDDASRDGSAHIARSFLEQSSVNGYLVSRHPNGGVSAARNVGWQHASGDWIQFLDADDVLAPAKIELQAAMAAEQAGDVAVVYSDWQHLAFQQDRWKPSGRVVQSMVDRDTVASIVADLQFGYVGPTLIRRSYLQRVGGFDAQLRLGEDIDLMLRLAMIGGTFHYLPVDAALFFYRETPGSLWHHATRSVDSMSALADVFHRAEEWLRGRDTRQMPTSTAQAFAVRYGKCLDVLFEHDRNRFHEVLAWMQALGWAYPPDARRSIQLFARASNYEWSLRFRALVRALGRAAKPGLAPLRVEGARAEPTAQAQIT